MNLTETLRSKLVARLARRQPLAQSVVVTDAKIEVRTRRLAVRKPAAYIPKPDLIRASNM